MTHVSLYQVDERVIMEGCYIMHCCFKFCEYFAACCVVESGMPAVLWNLGHNVGGWGRGCVGAFL